MKFIKWGFAILGFCVGFIGGNLIYNLLLVGWLHSTAVYWILSIGLGSLLGYLCFKRREDLAIITTSMMGAYAFIRGISMLAGGYPNEITMYEQIN